MSEFKTEIRIHPDHLNDENFLRNKAAKKLKIPVNSITGLHIIRRSIDARKSPIYNLQVVVTTEGTEFEGLMDPQPVFPNLSGREVVIVGAGPAGLFAALQLLELGVKPVVLERGKMVRDRRRDLAQIFKQRTIDEDSNYCFGEGGAGTFSDGKLYTRSKKRGDIRKVLETFVNHGATDQILVDAHPHIGTNKLPGIIENIREHIIAMGGEVHFETRVTGIGSKNGTIEYVETSSGKIATDSVILATGHSARDVFHFLERSGIEISSKPFALGVRVEHPQELIDQIQYNCKVRHPNLPPSSYRLVTQADGRGVFSFCMCPGGIIAPAMTAPGEIVVNGWSPSKRNGKFANSGFVVEIKEQDWAKMDAPEGLKALAFQSAVEHNAFQFTPKDLSAPAQRIDDFIRNRPSNDLPESSYLLGLSSADMHSVLPDFVADRIRKALIHFGKRMKGFTHGDAVMVGVESRTSSPVSIPRDRESLEHPMVKGLFPCGEGAGYAGGIVSAAMDGIACARKAAAFSPR